MIFYKEIRSGNIPAFYRNLVEIRDSFIIEDQKYTIRYFILPEIHNDKGDLKVVIYGWHKPDGKAIQPLYNGHTTLHVDYSHGIRLVQNKVWLNGKRSTIQKILKSETLHTLLSDEGMIREPIYPLK